jgi:uncharacterized membrane protein YiaA
VGEILIIRMSMISSIGLYIVVLFDLLEVQRDRVLFLLACIKCLFGWHWHSFSIWLDLM